MATVAGRPVTAEEFARMPGPTDGSTQELVRGEVVTMPPPGGRHGVCCLKIGRRLGNFIDDHKLGVATSNDAGFIGERDPDTVRGPDVAFWSKERLPEVPEGYITIPPDLAVEVVSPNDHFTRVHAKVRYYLACGVRMVWVIDPEDRSATVYRPDDRATILGEAGVLTGEDVLPGFACPVAEVLP